MPRLVYLIGLGIVASAVACCLTNRVVRPMPGPTEANVRRIKPGMSMKEAEAILGGPGQCGIDSSETGYWSATYEWAGPQGTVFVRVGGKLSDDGPGAITDAWFDCSSVPSPIQHLRSLLGL